MSQCRATYPIPQLDMAYGLSFAQRFFLDDDSDNVAPSEQPTSVYQAILSIRTEQWAAMAREVFQVEPHQLDPMAVLDQIQRTNTCSNLTSPVQVWIDEEGWYDVLVYDNADS